MSGLTQRLIGQRPWGSEMTNGTGYQAFRLGLDIITSIALVALAWLFYTLIDVDRRVVAIEASRFTQADAVLLQKQLGTMPAVAPPIWFEERVNRLELRMDGIDTKLEKLLESQRDR
jgi:hypothetical protein